MFEGFMNRMIQDLIAKGLQMAGAAIAGTGIATGEQTTAIVGGLGAILGVIWNVYTNSKTRQEVAITATANDTKKTTTQVVTGNRTIKPVAPDANRRV